MKKITIKKKKHNDKITMFILTFKKNPKIIEKLPAIDIVKMLQKANQSYYNTDSPILTDSQYDLLLELFAERFPTSPYLETVGATVITGKKVSLPYWLGSMDKIKPDTNALEKWVLKYPEPDYVLTDKLDGVSALLVNKVTFKIHIKKIKGRSHKVKVPKITRQLFTRGNGKVGQDISALVPFLNIPLIDKQFVVRGELIVSKKMFSKNSFGKKNARNMVSGLVNSKVYDRDTAKITRFVAYELISPRRKLFTQLAILRKLGFETVNHTQVKKVDNTILSNYLLKRREVSKYEIDGIIITANQIYPHPVSKNPKYSMAFKMVLDSQKAETTVIDVEWNASKDGFLKPRILVKTIVLQDCNINYATGYNAKYILDNKIGPGAKVEIIRSGDVIPKVTKVLEPSTNMKLPDQPYVWNETKIDFVLADVMSSKIVQSKRILKFFTTCEVPLLSTGNIAKFMDHGFDSVHKILNASQEDIATVPSFKGKMGIKIYNSIRNHLNEIDLGTLLAGSNCFGRGFGRRKMNPLVNAFPNILEETPSIEELLNVPGFSEKSVQHLLINLDSCKKFINDLPGWISVILPEQDDSVDDSVDSKSVHPLYQKKVVLSGTRNKDILKFLKEVKAKHSTSISKTTNLVIKKDEDSTSQKIENAVKLGIQVITVDEFIKNYM